MSKKKKTKAESKQEQLPVEQVEQLDTVQEKEVVAAAAAPEPIVEEVLHLSDASRRFVANYKEHWYPSIEKFAIAQGMTDLTAPTWKIKQILKAWGAIILD